MRIRTVFLAACILTAAAASSASAAEKKHHFTVSTNGPHVVLARNSRHAWIGLSRAATASPVIFDTWFEPGKEKTRLDKSK